MAKSWDDVTPNTGGNDRDKFKLEDHFRLVDKKRLDSKGNPKYFPFRIHPGGITSFEQAWIPLYKDGKPVIAQKGTNAGKGVEIPKLILSYNPDTEQYDPNIQDPYLDLISRMNEVIGDAKDQHGNSLRIRVQRTYLANVIHRLLERAPRDVVYPTDEEMQSGFITRESQTYSPWSVFPMAPGLTERIKNLRQLNKYVINGKEVTFPVADAKGGRDVNIKYDSSQAGSAMWDVQMGGNRMPLTQEESAALIWDLDIVTRHIQGLDLEAAQKDADQLSRGFFSGQRRGGGGGGRQAQRSLMDDDLPQDLAAGSGNGNRGGQQRRGGQQQPPSDFDDGFGGQGFGGDEFGGGDGGDFGNSNDFGGGGGDFGADVPYGDDNGFGSDNDFGGGDGGNDFGGSDFGNDAGSDFGGGGNDFGGNDFGGSDFGNDGGNDFGGSDFGSGNDFDAPAPAQNRQPQRQQPNQQQRGRGNSGPAQVDMGELDSLDEADQFGGDEFGGNGDGFGSDDFGGNDDFGGSGQQQPVRRGQPPQQQGRQAPAQNRQAQPQQRQPQQRPNPNQQQRPQQGNSAPQQRPNPQQQNRQPAPQQRQPQGNPNGGQQRQPNSGQQQRPQQGGQQRPMNNGQRPPQGRR